MKKQEYAKANKEWLQEKAKEEGVKEIPGGIYYKGGEGGSQRRTAPVETQHSDCPLYGQDHQRQEVRLLARRNTARRTPLRPHRRMDYRHAADVCGRQMGGVYPCRERLRQVLATGNTWRLHAHLRDRAVRHCLTGYIQKIVKPMAYIVSLSTSEVWKINIHRNLDVI